LLSAYDRAAKSETELMVTKKTLAETTEFLTSTRKDLNDAKDSLAKALEMHAEKTESEMKIEENLQQVTTACRYTNDLLNMMDAKLDDFQTSTKASTLSLGNEIEHSNATLGRVCDKVSSIESTAKQIASSQDLSSANNEERFDKISHSLEEIASKTHSIDLAQEKTFTAVCNIACKSDEIAATLTVDNEISNVTLNDIQHKVANLANKTDNIATVQDEVTKCLMDKLNRSSCSLESINDIIVWVSW
jgi:chromosome segregation ATPase